MNTEIWKPILGFEIRYEVSSFGRVKSLGHTTHDTLGRTRFRNDVILVPIERSGGYVAVHLGNNTHSRKIYSIHRLVAQTFIPNPNNKNQVNHLDGDKKNNRIENLEWSTCQENHVHSWDTLGKGHALAKLSREKVSEICQRRTENAKDLAKEYRVTFSQVYRIWKGKHRYAVP
jgi:HNH endonuclease/NUMOD4 motif